MMAEPEHLEAAVFDLDGVITFTARVHAAAWKELFDGYLRERASRSPASAQANAASAGKPVLDPFRPFDESDYREYVDGKPRYDGVASFLASRGIHLPYGTPADPPDKETVCGLGNRKDKLFNAKIHAVGVDVDWEAVRFVRELRQQGVLVGLASSSKNALPILEQAGLANLFEATVDGIDSEHLRLHGKPAPDIFLLSLKRLRSDADPRNALVAEDAIAGVQAGHRGGFGLVLGVDRNHQPNALAENGANMVISDFREISAERVREYFRSRAA